MICSVKKAPCINKTHGFRASLLSSRRSLLIFGFFFFSHEKLYFFFFFSHEKQVFPVTFWVWTTNVNFISIPTEGLFEEQAVEGGW